MQTFLPYSDFAASAAVIDNARLGNQCYRECKTLLNGGWKHHPASKMWRGYEGALCMYALALADEMGRRFKPDGSPKWKPEVVTRWQEYFDTSMNGLLLDMPPWLGDDRLHSTHRGRLLAKDAVWYSQFNWTEKPIPENSGYWWPV